MKKLNLDAIYKTAKTFMTKHTPEILTGIGIAGMITTTVLAVKATPTALELIEETHDELYPLDDYKEMPVPITEAVKACWKCYLPAVITGVTSTACLIGAVSVSSRRTAALAAAYRLSETNLAEYMEKTLKTVGEKKEKNIHEKISEDRVEQNPVPKSVVVNMEHEGTLFMEPLSKRYFKSDVEVIRRAVNKVNAQILNDISGYVSLNDFYDELELEHTDLGYDLGWNTSHLLKLDFDLIKTDDDKALWVIYYENAPKYKYDSIF